FLSEDDAKTMGDIEYMRSSKVVKRTFAKKKGETEEMESVKRISAMSSNRLDENGLVESKPATPFKPSSSSQLSSFAEASASTPVAPPAPPVTPAPAVPPAPQAAPTSAPANQSGVVSNQTESERRASDSSMDMFRNMAKQIRK
ncbi:MAG: hypothetical protein AAGC54_03445, partial [Cyanobacteria bacterium P01_F01_bin.4]